MSKDSLSTKQHIVAAEPTKTNPIALAITLFTSAFVFYSSQFIAALTIILSLTILGNEREQTAEIIGDNRIAQLLLILLVAAFVSFFVIKILQLSKESPKKFLLLSKRPTWSQVGEVVLTYGLYFLVLVVVTVTLGIFTGVNVDQVQELGITKPDTIDGKLIIFFMLAVVPPIYEEILFRGFLFNALKKYGSFITAAVLTSVLFGAAHLEYDNLNYIAAIDTLIFSGFLIYISQKHQSLYSAMLLHAIKNSIAFYVVFVR